MTPRTEQQYRDRIGELEEQVRQLLAVIADPDVHFPARWDLTPGEARALRCLWKAKTYRSTEMIRIAISRGETSGRTLVNTVICRLRAKLKSEKIEIVCRKAEGYELTADSRLILAQHVIQPITGRAA